MARWRQGWLLIFGPYLEGYLVGRLGLCLGRGVRLAGGWGNAIAEGPGWGWNWQLGGGASQGQARLRSSAGSEG